MTRAALATAFATLLPAGPLSLVSETGAHVLCAVGFAAIVVFVALAARGRRIAAPLEESAPTLSCVRARKKSAPLGSGADSRLAAAAHGSPAPCEGAPHQSTERRIAREGAVGISSPEVAP